MSRRRAVTARKEAESSRKLDVFAWVQLPLREIGQLAADVMNLVGKERLAECVAKALAMVRELQRVDAMVAQVEASYGIQRSADASALFDVSIAQAVDALARKRPPADPSSRLLVADVAVDGRRVNLPPSAPPAVPLPQQVVASLSSDAKIPWDPSGAAPATASETMRHFNAEGGRMFALGTRAYGTDWMVGGVVHFPSSVGSGPALNLLVTGDKARATVSTAITAFVRDSLAPLWTQLTKNAPVDITLLDEALETLTEAGCEKLTVDWEQVLHPALSTLVGAGVPLSAVQVKQLFAIGARNVQWSFHFIHAPSGATFSLGRGYCEPRLLIKELNYLSPRSPRQFTEALFGLCRTPIRPNLGNAVLHFVSEFVAANSSVWTAPAANADAIKKALARTNTQLTALLEGDESFDETLANIVQATQNTECCVMLMHV